MNMPILPRSDDGSINYSELVNRLGQTWPSRMARAAWGGLTLPGDVYRGNVSMWGEDGRTNQEVINRAADLAGLIQSGTFGLAPSGSLGSGPVKGKLGSGSEPPLGAQPVSANTELSHKLFGLSNMSSEKISPGTLEDFFSRNNIAFRKQNSASFSDVNGPSSSTYYYIDHPGGTLKLRLSDHSYGIQDGVDLRYGQSIDAAMGNILPRIGLRTTPAMDDAVRTERISGIRDEISRLSDLVANPQTMGRSGYKQDLKALQEALEKEKLGGGNMKPSK